MIIYGKNSVLDLLGTSPGEITEIIVADKSGFSKDQKLKDSVKKKGIRFFVTSKNELDRLCHSQKHQGIAAKTKPFNYSSVKEILDIPRQRNENAFLLILDHIEDPQNLGAIIRTADFMGVHGVIIPKDRACEVNPTVVKVSSGAVNNVKIAKETNISQLIDKLKKQNIWIVGADGKSKSGLSDQDFKNLDVAVVIGNEGRGLSQKIKEKCDFLLSIPKKGKVESLNASVAAGLFLYEVSKDLRTN